MLVTYQDLVTTLTDLQAGRVALFHICLFCRGWGDFSGLSESSSKASVNCRAVPTIQIHPISALLDFAIDECLSSSPQENVSLEEGSKIKSTITVFTDYLVCSLSSIMRFESHAFVIKIRGLCLVHTLSRFNCIKPSEAYCLWNQSLVGCWSLYCTMHIWSSC